MIIDTNDLLKKRKELENSKKEIDEQIRGIDCVLALYNVKSGSKKKADKSQEPAQPDISLKDLCLKIIKNAKDVQSLDQVLDKVNQREFVFTTKNPQQSVSRALKKLVDAEIIDSFKDGVKVYYQKKEATQKTAQ